MSYNPEKQKKYNPVKRLSKYIKKEQDYYLVSIPVNYLVDILGNKYFENDQLTSSAISFDFTFDDVVRAPAYSKRVLYLIVKANYPNFNRFSLYLPFGARALPFSTVTHWTPQGFRSSDLKSWERLDNYAVLVNDNVTNLSISFDLPSLERFEKTILVILSTLFGVGISAVIEAFLALGTAGLVGILARKQEDKEVEEKSEAQISSEDPESATVNKIS